MGMSVKTYWTTNASVLIEPHVIRERIAELGRQITLDNQGKSLVLIGVLKGAAIFMADLIREIHLPIEFDFVAISSYGADTKTSGIVRLIKDSDISLQDRHIIIVEDIVDTGLTLRYLLEVLQSRQPTSLKVCALLNKPSQRSTPIQIDYCGFELLDQFVVGYGLDINERYRNLPYIGVLEESETGK
jgi:hypoxanthine phosphoribosyltransferase